MLESENIGVALISGNDYCYTTSYVTKDKLDPKFLAEIEQLKKMVHELYYPMVPYKTS